MCCGGFIGDVFEGLGDIVEGVVDVVGDIAEVVTDVIDGAMSSIENIMSDPMALISIGLSLAVPGIGTAIGSALGASGTAATVLGNSVMRGVMAEASGGDFIEAAFTSAVTGGMGEYAGDVGGAFGIEDAVTAKAVGSAVLKTGYAAVTGGNVSNALLEGAVASAISTTNSTMTKDTELPTDVISGIDPSYKSSDSYDEFMKIAMEPETDVAVKTDTNTVAANAPDNIDVGGGWSPATEAPEYTPYVAIDATEKEGSLAKPVETTKEIGFKDVAKAVIKYGAPAAVGASATSLMRKSSQPADFNYKLPSQKELYKDAPIAGYQMVKLTNDQGAVKYIPFINGIPQLEVPSGYKPAPMAKGGFVHRQT